MITLVWYYRDLWGSLIVSLESLLPLLVNSLNFMQCSLSGFLVGHVFAFFCELVLFVSETDLCIHDHSFLGVCYSNPNGLFVTFPVVYMKCVFVTAFIALTSKGWAR